MVSYLGVDGRRIMDLDLRRVRKKKNITPKKALKQRARKATKLLTVATQNLRGSFASDQLKKSYVIRRFEKIGCDIMILTETKKGWLNQGVPLQWKEVNTYATYGVTILAKREVLMVSEIKTILGISERKDSERKGQLPLERDSVLVLDHGIGPSLYY